MPRTPARTLDRRSLLAAAGRAGGAAAAGGLLSSWAAILGLDKRTAAAAPAPEPLTQPPEIRSLDGVLQATITAAPGTVKIDDFSFPGLLYNSAYVPPVLRTRLGDTLRVVFRNNLADAPSNLHFHGMSVSPQGNSDNVFVHVHPGSTFQYDVRIPSAGRQGPGMFWYHPHAHGFVNPQILGGMSGGLVVDGAELLFPILKDLPERFLLIKHAELGEGNQVISVNGQLNPAIEIRPGEMQFWRIAHIGASLFIKFRIAGMPLYVLATDGHPLSQPRKLTEFFIGPGERIDAIAIGPQPGEYPLQTISFQNEAWRPAEQAQQLAVVTSAGPGSSGADLENDVLRQRLQSRQWADEVRAAPIARRRTLVYSRTPDRKVFMIDGQVIDETRVDQTVKLGDTEQWTIVNTDQQYHSFHIHQTPFLVTEVGGVAGNDDSLRDTVSVPPATDQSPGQLKVLIPFTDPVIVGRFVYHCHAVDHEDKGMMGVIEVVA
jgi:FtsP/CotA-like multicopper oxidase with cupredoxin domain